MTAGAGTYVMDSGESRFARGIMWGAVALGMVAVTLRDLVIPVVGHVVVDYNVNQSLTQFEQAALSLAGDLSPETSPSSEQQTKATYTILVDNKVVSKLSNIKDGVLVLSDKQSQAEFSKVKRAVRKSIWASHNTAPSVHVRYDNGRSSKDHDLVQSDFLQSNGWTSLQKGVIGVWARLQKPIVTGKPTSFQMLPSEVLSRKPDGAVGSATALLAQDL